MRNGGHPPGRVAPVSGEDRALMSGDGSDVVGITQRELLLEMRTDVKALGEGLEALAKDAALNVERRATSQRLSDAMSAEISALRRDTDELRRWRDRADGAMVLARWALGASLVSLFAVAIQLISALTARSIPT